MRLHYLAALAVLAVAGCGAPEPAPDIDWMPSLALGIERAAEQEKDVFVFFHASWCGVCERMKRRALSEAAVRRALQDFVSVSVDVDAQAYLAEKYRVDAVPAVMVMNSHGVVQDRFIGGLDGEQLRAFLERWQRG